MVAHKYSYGIPEARKTFIPAEAHMCASPPRVYSAILRPASGKVPTNSGEKLRNYDFSAEIFREIRVFFRGENTSFLIQINFF
jgi:hypothetical protein